MAYFISGNLTTELALACEMDLLRLYHDELEARGIAGYDFETCLQDYQLSKLFIVYRLILGIDMIDFSVERGTQLIRSWLDRLFALIPPDYDGLYRRASGESALH